MKTKFLTFAALVAMMASCSSENDFIKEDEGKPQPITVTASVAELNTRAGYETPDGGTEVLPKNFYLTITQDDTEGSQYNYTNKKLTLGDNNQYAYDGTMYWKRATPSPTAVTAYTIEGTEVSVQKDQTTMENVLASDLLGAKLNDGVTINGNNISVAFRHLLCKLDVTVKWGTELDNMTSKKFTGVTLYGLNCANATLDRTTATVSTENATVDDIKAFATISNSECVAEAIFLPSSTANPIIVIHTEIQKPTEQTASVRNFQISINAPDGGFVAGSRYTADVIVGGTVVGNVQANIKEGWVNANEEEIETDENQATE